MRYWTVLGLAIVLVASPARGVAPPDETSLEELVRLYRSGDREKAVALAYLWGNDTVQPETWRLLYAVGSRESAEQGEAERLVAAVILTESALLHLRVGASRRARRELEAAAQLIETGPLGAGGGYLARRLYLVAGLALHWRVELEAGHALLLEALRREPDDPELITALGSIIETVATLRHYDPPPGARDWMTRSSGGYSAEAGGRGSLPGASLSQAEARYEQALAIDPRLVEARLRLGRVRLLRGRAEQALPDLERAAVEARLPGQRYLARLFEGRAREKLDDLAGAAAAFSAATTHAPGAQTGLLALGRSLDRLGDVAGAQDALARASQRDAPFDPWLGYQCGQPERVEGLLAELRGLVP